MNSTRFLIFFQNLLAFWKFVHNYLAVFSQAKQINFTQFWNFCQNLKHLKISKHDKPFTKFYWFFVKFYQNLRIRPWFAQKINFTQFWIFYKVLSKFENQFCPRLTLPFFIQNRPKIISIFDFFVKPAWAKISKAIGLRFKPRADQIRHKVANG